MPCEDCAGFKVEMAGQKALMTQLFNEFRSHARSMETKMQEVLLKSAELRAEILEKFDSLRSDITASENGGSQFPTHSQVNHDLGKHSKPPPLHRYQSIPSTSETSVFLNNHADSVIAGVCGSFSPAEWDSNSSTLAHQKCSLGLSENDSQQESSSKDAFPVVSCNSEMSEDDWEEQRMDYSSTSSMSFMERCVNEVKDEQVPSSAMGIDNLAKERSSNNGITENASRLIQRKKKFGGGRRTVDTKCEECGNMIAVGSSTHKRNHAVLHLGVKPFQCTNCSSDFFRMDNAAAHVQRFHPKLENLKESIVWTVDEMDYTAKLVAKTEECFPYPISLSNAGDALDIKTKPLSKPDGVILMDKQHSPFVKKKNAPSYCKLCHRVVASKWTHVRCHFDWKPYKCSYCDYTTRHGRNVVRHMKMRHDIQESPANKVGGEEDECNKAMIKQKMEECFGSA